MRLDTRGVWRQPCYGVPHNKEKYSMQSHPSEKLWRPRSSTWIVCWICSNSSVGIMSRPRRMATKSAFSVCCQITCRRTSSVHTTMLTVNECVQDARGASWPMTRSWWKAAVNLIFLMEHRACQKHELLRKNTWHSYRMSGVLFCVKHFRIIKICPSCVSSRCPLTKKHQIMR